MGTGSARIVLLLATAGGCDAGSSNGGQASKVEAQVDGTIQGQGIVLGDVIAAKGVDNASDPNQVSVIFSTTSNFCPIVQELLAGPPAQQANNAMLILLFGAQDPSATVTPGTYDVPTKTLNATYETYDGACELVPPTVDVTAGRATVTSVGTSIRGTFDLTFGTDEIAGTFDAPFCDVAPSGVASPDGGIDCLRTP